MTPQRCVSFFAFVFSFSFLGEKRLGGGVCFLGPWASIAPPPPRVLAAIEEGREIEDVLVGHRARRKRPTSEP